MTTWAQVIASVFDVRPLQRRVVALPGGGVLRFEHARGSRVRVNEGRVWITEERREDDVVLDAKGSHRIVGQGRAIVTAERASSVAVEWPDGARAPLIEVARAAGEPGRPLPGSRVRRAWLSAAFAAWRSTAAHARRVTERADPTPDGVRDRLAAHVPLLRA